MLKTMLVEKPALPTVTHLEFTASYFITVALLRLKSSRYVTNGVPSGAMANEV